MNWDALLGQGAAVQCLRAALRAGRAPHGYLFEGPPGVGKRTGAALLAQALLCQRPPAPDLACGECKSCRWMAGLRGGLSDHPDLLPLLKNPEEKEKPQKLLGDQEQVIPLETVQWLATQLHRAPSQGPRRVAIIPEAQRMCAGQAEAANAFLKTLEEPPLTSVVILTSSRPEALLETILSRLQPVRFHRLSSDAVRAGLTRGEKKFPAEELELAVAMSDGSLGRARELLEGDLKAWRKALLKELAALDRHACPRFGLALWALAEQEGLRLYELSQGGGDASAVAAADGGEEDEGAGKDEEESRKSEAGWRRFVFQRLLELCEAAFRDALLASAEAGPFLLLNGPDATLATRLAGQFGAAGCERVLESLRDARLANRLYVRGDLLGRVLAGRIVEGLRQGAGG
jgi:DNA polymerase-3 subunit delta'